MVVFFEVSGPIQWRPSHFNSRIMRRVVWLWFAFGWLHIPFHEYGSNAYEWRER